jgi:hypothetical protein
MGEFVKMQEYFFGFYWSLIVNLEYPYFNFKEVINTRLIFRVALFHFDFKDLKCAGENKFFWVS